MGTEKRLDYGLREWKREYDEVIRPMRDEADAGRGSYQDYDEAYNEHLEDLHHMICSADLDVLDNAARAAEFIRGIGDYPTQEEMIADPELCPNGKDTASWILDDMRFGASDELDRLIKQARAFFGEGK